MGYILPISHFEYTNYQRRVIHDKNDLHYIEKPYKITLDMQQQFMYDHDVTNHTMRKKNNTPFEKIRVTRSDQDQQIAKITGKGSIFNESV
jgi:hypothetical protein